MPVRLCQKCGLKVLIEPNQADVTPFLCHRCSATEKPPEGGAPPEVDAAALAIPSDAPPEPVPPPGGSKSGPVKVLCPYCKASFSGRLPSRPAKGACPACRKDLVLLPDGKIRPAATFDLTKWQKEQEQQKFGGDPAVAEQARAAQKALDRFGLQPEASPAAPPSEGPEPFPPDARVAEPVPQAAEPTLVSPQLPGADPLGGLVSETMLDMGRPDLDDLARAALHKAAREPEPPPPAEEKHDDGNGSSPPPVDEPPAPAQEEAPPSPPDTEPPPPPAEPAPVPVASEEPPARKTSVEKAGTSGRPHPAKVAIGVILLLLPLAVGGICFGLKGNKKLEGFVNKVGAIANKGLRTMHERLAPKAEPPRPPRRPEPPKPVEPPPSKQASEEVRKDLEEKILKEHRTRWAAQREIKKFPDPSGEQANYVQRQKEIRDEATKRYEEFQRQYRKLFGKDYDPTAALNKDLEPQQK